MNSTPPLPLRVLDDCEGYIFQAACWLGRAVSLTLGQPLEQSNLSQLIEDALAGTEKKLEQYKPISQSSSSNGVYLIKNRQQPPETKVKSPTPDIKNKVTQETKSKISSVVSNFLSSDSNGGESFQQGSVSGKSKKPRNKARWHRHPYITEKLEQNSHGRLKKAHSSNSTNTAFQQIVSSVTGSLIRDTLMDDPELDADALVKAAEKRLSSNDYYSCQAQHIAMYQ
ncbi:hypothetical protein M3P05_12180 [Sansalvadorimonas sp. 2012CJ34-2]|uniref:Uncharacterized protein n=1 Tax=Parendozoicomonas callyspongiae TaxID=2942213 RepID=A0ABT0PH33_9GAMM|nr:hypothetical protein [Sansalvadorimonas sp. 2012CJ34-2]MCL6270684.1 hypothetical protein [Sansalvadorimonas sp. 2012CJ34-2]